jgi:fibronectin type 3 domain-containing protein
MADTYDIELIQGSSFSLSVTATDNNGIPIDLSGYSMTGQIKSKYSDSTILAAISPTIESPSVSGIFSIALTAAQTAALPITIAVYDVEATSPSNTVTKLLRGYCYVAPEVTR